jgi:glutamate racemase
MKIGIFDSGLGGLVVARTLRKAMPQYDYIHLGDTKRLPYGNKSQTQIYKNTVRAISYLLEQDCALVIVACNTASSQALRKIQQSWLPQSSQAKYKNRRILGVVRPTVESIGKFKNIGLIGTLRTVDSTAYVQELKKMNEDIKLTAKATPKLVPMIEQGNLRKQKEYKQILENYLIPFKNTKVLILGCTHYGIIKNDIQKILGKKIKIIAQEELLPKKLQSYLAKHTEIQKQLSKNRTFELLVTKSSKRYEKLSSEWFGKVTPKLIKI